jgi:hypothetical protein
MAILMILAGCTNSKSSSMDGIGDGLVEKTRDYEIYDISKYNRTQYQYFIFDMSHQVLDDGVTLRRIPQISKDNNIIKLIHSAGMGLLYCRYYDIENKLVSDWFTSPLDETTTMIAYGDYTVGTTMIIVQNIFDKKRCYLEIRRNFSNRGLISAEFVNEGKQLHITYKAGDNNHGVTEYIDLSK